VERPRQRPAVDLAAVNLCLSHDATIARGQPQPGV
jgi:hypothetical protein